MAWIHLASRGICYAVHRKVKVMQQRSVYFDVYLKC